MVALGPQIRLPRWSRQSLTPWRDVARQLTPDFSKINMTCDADLRDQQERMNAYVASRT